MVKFHFLEAPFKTWLKGKLDTYFLGLETDFLYGESYIQLLETLKMSKEDFIERFINPYRNLSLTELLAVAKIQTELCNRELKLPLFFSIRPLLEQYMNALEWTISNIADLGWFELGEEVFLFYKVPYKQCHLCGKLDTDRQSPPKSFGENHLLRCHAPGCFSEDKDTGNLIHTDDCCAMKWDTERENLRISINRIFDRKNKTAVNREESAIKVFLGFCDKRLLFNQESLRNTINTIETRSIEIESYNDLKK